MTGVKGMRGQKAPPHAFKKGHTVQPSMEERPTTIQRANRTKVAQRLREVVAQVEPADTLAWLYDAVELARGSGDAKALLQAVELVWLYGIGKPREQLSEREGIDMLSVIEAAARQMNERTIEGETGPIEENDRGGGSKAARIEEEEEEEAATKEGSAEKRTIKQEDEDNRTDNHT